MFRPNPPIGQTIRWVRPELVFLCLHDREINSAIPRLRCAEHRYPGSSREAAWTQWIDERCFDHLRLLYVREWPRTNGSVATGVILRMVRRKDRSASECPSRQNR